VVTPAVHTCLVFFFFWGGCCFLSFVLGVAVLKLEYIVQQDAAIRYYELLPYFSVHFTNQLNDFWANLYYPSELQTAALFSPCSASPFSQCS
jgi:hypothetical protein